MGGSTPVSARVRAIICSMTRRTSSVRVVTVSFTKRRFRWVCAVCSVMLGRVAIPFLCEIVKRGLDDLDFALGSAVGRGALCGGLPGQRARGSGGER